MPNKFAVVGKKQRAFAVVVESSRRINVFRKTKFVERPVISFGRELAEDAKWFVEKDDGRHEGLGSRG